MKKTKTPERNMMSIFLHLWNSYGEIFEAHETLKSKPFGRPPIPVKKAFRAIMYILWTGCSWRSLPPYLGKRSTINGYFLKWSKCGLFKTLWEKITEDAAKKKSLAINFQIIDASHVMAVYTNKEMSGFSYKYKNKRAVKISILVDSKGVPVSLSLGPANVHDAKLLEKTLGESVVEAKKPSKKALLGDSGYIGEDQENSAGDFGFDPNFRPRKNMKVIYTQKQMNQNKKSRWLVERTISWIKNMRRIRFCYERSIENFKAFCQLACAYVVFRRCLI